LKKIILHAISFNWQNGYVCKFIEKFIHDFMPVKSLQLFVSKLIDYAGLFPPSSLDLKSAFNNYLAYTSHSPFSWMLAKFVCPASKLSELDKLIENEKTTFKNPLSFSVLGSSSVHSSEFLDSISHEVSLISGFNSKYSSKINIDAFETRLPDDIFSIKGDDVLYDIIRLASNKLGKVNGEVLPLFLESLPDENLPALTDAISKHNKSGGKSAYKLRTGGAAAASFQSSAKIAFAIKTCIDREVPIKCTAGLHHPIRHYNESVKTKMQGFINVFGAGILNVCLNLPEDIMTEILNDEEIDNFHFSDSSFGWKDYHVLASRIQEAREQFMISYGSCSFDEPVYDLKNLGLL
jgi:hypothetical protein